MSYEEARLDCPRCRRETWHGRDVADVFRARSLVASSHVILLFTHFFVAWRCLECGGRTRGRAKPVPYFPAVDPGPNPGQTRQGDA